MTGYLNLDKQISSRSAVYTRLTFFTDPDALSIAAAVMMACALLFWLGRTLGKPFNASVNGGQALMQKNTAFAIWVANTYLNPLSSVGPGCYILWQNIVNSVEIWAHGRKAGRP